LSLEREKTKRRRCAVEGPSVAAYFAEATKAKKAMEGKLKVGRKTQDTRHKTQDEEEEVMSLLVFSVQFSGRKRKR
jgi:hypothetical protein